MKLQDTSPLIHFQNVSKHYGVCRANDGLEFSVEKNSIHAVVGENGAGKSTAMKLLYGMETPTSGTIYVRGKAAHYRSSRGAIADGIGMVHQHFMLSGRHTALDNVLLTTWDRSPGLSLFRPLNRNKLAQELDVICNTIGFNVSWSEPVERLSVSAQQQVEIVKLLHAGVEIMIFDEPTAVLSPPEIAQFLAMLMSLKAQGKTIVLITHKLREVMEVSDRITVMRGGQTVSTKEKRDTSVQELADLMVGRSVQLSVSRPPPAECGAVALGFRNFCLDRGAKSLLSNLGFEVRAGEIVGLAGVEGNGQSELLGYLYEPRAFQKHGFRVSGVMTLGQSSAAEFSSADVRNCGVGVIAADRHHESVLLDDSLLENDLLGHLSEYCRFGLLNRRKARHHSASIIDEFDVRPRDCDAIMASLSGGNQQKFVFAREISRSPRLLICAQPTRGVDVGSIEQIHRTLLEARSRGMAVFLVSSQLDELMQLSDRLLVMADGRITASFERGQYDEHAIGLAMLGGGR